MALESRIKLTADNFSPQSDLIEVFSKKAGVVGVINPSQIAFPPSGGAGAIQFSDGSAFASDASNLFWDNTNKRLGIGTNAPSARLTAQTTSAADGIVLQDASNPLALIGKWFDSSGFFDLSQNGTPYTRIQASQSYINTPITFGSASALSARVGIKGSGSTSATTSLLVQNSAGTQILKVQDDGQVFVNQGNQQVTFTGAGGISRIQAPNEMTIGLGASFNAMKVYYDGRVGLQNDAVFINSGNLGIGTSSPASILQVIGTTNIARFGTSTNYWKFNTNYSSDQSLEMVNQGGAGTNTYYNTKLLNETYQTKLLIGEYQNYLSFGKYDNHQMASLFNNGNFVVGSSSDLSARVGIKGSGSTSATTSLLVQSSSGDQIFKIKDDGSSDFGRSGANSLASFYGLTGLTCIIGNDSIQTPSNIYRVTNGQLTFYGRNNNANAFSFEHNNSQQSNASGVSMINIGGGYATQQNAQFSSLQITPSYNLDSNTTTNSIARGIYYNPTITNLRTAQHRAIETVTGDVLLGTTSGKVLSGYLAAMGSPINDTLAIHLAGSQVFQVGNPLTTDQFMVIDSVAGSKRGIKFGNQGSTRQGIFLNNNDLQIAECNATNYNPWLTIDYLSNGNVTIGAGATTSIGAKLGIKGSGSTSATTSLLVQNSAGSQLLKITDNGITKVGGNGTFGYLAFGRSSDSTDIGDIQVTSSQFFQFTEYGGNGFRFLDGFGKVPMFLANGKASVNKNAIADASAQFEVVSTTGGILFPRMTTTQKNAISTPAAGLVVFDTDLNKLCVRGASAWETITSV